MTTPVVEETYHTKSAKKIPKVSNNEWRSALTTLKKAVDDQEQGLYDLKLRARLRFREMGYKNYLGMAEFLMEIYTATFAFGADQESAEGWIFKTHKRWEEHHGLSRDVVDAARKGVVEKLGLVEERRWKGNRLEFRLFPAAVIQLLYPEEQAPSTTDSDCGKPPIQIGGNPQASLRETLKPIEEKRREPTEALSSSTSSTTTNVSSTSHGSTDGLTEEPVSRPAWGTRERDERELGLDAALSGPSETPRSSKRYGQGREHREREPQLNTSPHGPSENQYSPGASETEAPVEAPQQAESEDSGPEWRVGFDHNGTALVFEGERPHRGVPGHAPEWVKGRFAEASRFPIGTRKRLAAKGRRLGKERIPPGWTRVQFIEYLRACEEKWRKKGDIKAAERAMRERIAVEEAA